MKLGLIGKTQMTWYYEISSHIFSIRTGTALAGRNNCSYFTSKSGLNGAKHAKRRDEIFFKKQYKANKHHHYHHLFFCDRFHCV